jgi:opacity protein-like surface antigen
LYVSPTFKVPGTLTIVYTEPSQHADIVNASSASVEVIVNVGVLLGVDVTEVVGVKVGVEVGVEVTVLVGVGVGVSIGKVSVRVGVGVAVSEIVGV